MLGQDLLSEMKERGEILKCDNPGLLELDVTDLQSAEAAKKIVAHMISERRRERHTTKD